ncbi:MAG TPA: hypothetical protein VI385_07055 [Flavisolibacter sp.]
MKQLLVICVLTLQLFGLHSANAGMVAPVGAESITRKSAAHSLFLQRDHPAEISPTVRIVTTALKARYHRSPAGAVNVVDGASVLAVPSAKNPDNYTSPLYLPLIRLLLYPKHYFW